MKKLPQVLLVLTALGLGVMYGHYNFSIERGLAPRDRSFVSHVANTLRNLGKKPQPGDEFGEETVDDTNNWYGSGKGTPAVKFRNRLEGEDLRLVPLPGDTEQVERPKDEEPTYNTKLKKVDSLIMKSSLYLSIAMRNVERREECAQKAFDCTTESLDILDPLSVKYPDNREIKERLQTVTKQRHDATKLAPARQKEKE